MHLHENRIFSLLTVKDFTVFYVSQNIVVGYY